MERNIVPIHDLLRTKCHTFSHRILLPYRGLLYLHYKGRKCTCEIPAALCKGQKVMSTFKVFNQLPLIAPVISVCVDSLLDSAGDCLDTFASLLHITHEFGNLQ